MDFEKEEYTPMIDTKKPKPKLGAKAGNTQEFSSLNGVNVKDKAARENMEELAEYIGTLPPEPWQPLEDGYSNFWFELTNDTLSPWLNFSAKNADATIDWGDGSGEVALDTLTPTHTYSKAGRYIVKCKGVTGIAMQQTTPYQGKYLAILTAVELNNQVTNISSSAFRYCVKLENFIAHATSITIGNSIFYACSNLQSVSLPQTVSMAQQSFVSNCLALEDIAITTATTELSNSSFYYCISLKNITIPNSVTAIGNSVFQYCGALAEIYVEATTPPTVGTGAFSGLPSNYIIYVPVGYGDTYKAASGWSDYADHILEEGQTPNRAMLAKFNSAKTDEPQDDMR